MIAKAILLFVFAVHATAASASPTSSAARWITLGTGGGPVVQLKRGQPANALVVDGRVYLFDAGEGTQQRMKAAGVALSKVRAIFLSHHHLDHVGGVAPIIGNRWINQERVSVAIFGPPGTREFVSGLLSSFRPIERAPLAIGEEPVPPIASLVTASDLSPEPDPSTVIYSDAYVRVTAVAVDHFHDARGRVLAKPRSYAFRAEAGGRVFVFSGDTGPSPNLERLAVGADVLVCEVVDRAAIASALSRMDLTDAAEVGLLRHMDFNHLTPTQAGAIAAAAKVKTLVLTHLVPGRDEERDTNGYTAGIAQVFTGTVVVARDGDAF